MIAVEMRDQDIVDRARADARQGELPLSSLSRVKEKSLRPTSPCMHYDCGLWWAPGCWFQGQ